MGTDLQTPALHHNKNSPPPKSNPQGFPRGGNPGKQGDLANTTTTTTPHFPLLPPFPHRQCPSSHHHPIPHTHAPNGTVKFPTMQAIRHLIAFGFWLESRPPSFCPSPAR